MEGSHEPIEQARCVRLLLGGGVSCDHILQEYGGTAEGLMAQALRIVEEAAGAGRYAVPAPLTAEQSSRLEELAAAMEEGGT